MAKAEQGVTRNASDDPNRRPDGTFAPGNNANPEGGNSNKGWTPYRKRCQMLMEKYTPEEIVAIASDKKLLNLQSSIDAIALVHLARTIDAGLTTTQSGADDVRGERKELLDRIEGQSKQVLANDEDNPLNPKPDDEAIARKIAFALASLKTKQGVNE